MIIFHSHINSSYPSPDILQYRILPMFYSHADSPVKHTEIITPGDSNNGQLSKFTTVTNLIKATLGHFLAFAVKM